MNKYWKEMSNMYNVPHFDCICDEDKREYPVRYNYETQTLEYYNGQTEMWTDISQISSSLLLQTNGTDNDEQEILNLVDSDTVSVSYDGNGDVSFHVENASGDFVESVTGDLVDNTDPQNPVVNTPSLQNVLDEDSNITGPHSIVSDDEFTIDATTINLDAAEINIPLLPEDNSATKILSFDTATKEIGYTDKITDNSQLTNGAGYLTSIAAAGSNTQIQFNNAGVLGADSNLYWDNTNKMLYASLANANTTLDNIVTSKRVRCQGVNVLNNSSYMAGILRSPVNSFMFDLIGYGTNHSQIVGTFGSDTYNLSLYGNRYIDLGTGVSSSALKILTSFVSAANSLGIGDVRVIDNQPTINVTDAYSPNFVGYYYNPTVGNLNAGRHIAAHIVSGDVIIGDLAGIGDRMVVAEADGKLNTQAIPTQINNTEYAEAAYTGSITWTGSTAPSGTENHRQVGQSVNKRMSVDIRLQYTTNGAGLTAVVLALPATYPAPKLLNGVSMTPSKILYPGTAIGARSDSDASVGIGRTFLAVNSAGTWYDIYCVFGSATVGYLSVSIEYPIN